MLAPAEASFSLEALLTGRGGLDHDTFRRALSAGGITINRRRAARADEPVAVRDVVTAHLAERGRSAQGPRPIGEHRVLLIDEHVVVVDKPPTIAAQGTLVDAQAGLDASVAALLRARGEKRAFAGLVHRLDLETSGVTLFGRTPEAVSHLTRQFREGRVRKRYLALASGAPEWTDRHVDEPIAASHDRPGVYVTSPRGRPARTDFTCLERIQGRGVSFARIEARPLTGRTHQIRVHARHLGHPLLGDRRYGGPGWVANDAGVRVELPRVCLHAAALVFEHPAGGEREVTAPWPEDLAEFEERLREAARPA